MGSFERFTSFTALGGTWLVIDWDATRLPAALTTGKSQ
jgi:hypothetical protein